MPLLVEGLWKIAQGTRLAGGLAKSLVLGLNESINNLWLNLSWANLFTPCTRTPINHHHSSLSKGFATGCDVM
jgi:hypothetical protein